MSSIDVVVPDLGNFQEVPVVDVLVRVGDAIEVDTPLITLETDKASMDVPAAAAGTLSEVLVKKGDKVSKGTVIARMTAAASAGTSASGQVAGDAGTAAGAKEGQGATAVSPLGSTAESAAGGDTVRIPRPGTEGSRAELLQGLRGAPEARTPERPGLERPGPTPDRKTGVLVLGAGPGGYTAAFRAADLGLRVTLVERWASLGGVCLNDGCIPSKALLHAAKVIEDAQAMAANGIAFGEPRIDREKLRGWKNSVVKKLTGGLKLLARQRKVEVVQGVGRFVGPHVLEVTRDGRAERIGFEQCIIAAGSEALTLPGWPQDPRIMDSSEALELPAAPRLLVVGGGIIGLEMACVYDGLGSKVTVVELTPQLMPGCDPDLVKPLEKRIRARYQKVLVGTRVTAVEPETAGLKVSFAGEGAPAPQVFDRVLVAVGRRPNGLSIGAEAAGVKVSERGYIPVDKQMRTNVPHIFAIGDIAGPPMLAHKASHEAKVAAEVAAGQRSAFDARVIPSVAYTDPEIAWVGLTESEAQTRGVAYRKGLFPWAASGRSLALGRDDGFTKLLFDPETHRLMGGGIVGPDAGDLISEVALAIEMGSDGADIGLTVHPHPTLSETVAFAAEAFEGTLTDLYMPKK